MAEFKVCNFCGRGENSTGAMFSAGTTNICDKCIIYCYEQLMGPELMKAKSRGISNSRLASSSEVKLMKPAEKSHNSGIDMSFLSSNGFV